MQKITPFLWFNKEAKEAAGFYATSFNNVFGPIYGQSIVKGATILNDTPSGSVDIVPVSLVGQEFTLMNAGPLFRFTPAISFLVACRTKKEANALWKKFSRGGTALMEIGEYPFSKRYGWIQDKYGLSWQIMFMGDSKIKQIITPTLMYTGMQAGRAEEAINFYASVFRNARVSNITRYEAGDPVNRKGTVMFAEFTLEGQEFCAMDSAHKHEFTFNEAISFVVNCKSQDEIDYYWNRLSADPKSEQCGWLKDKYGVSWQIVPIVMEVMLGDKDTKKVARLTKAFLKMKKFDIDQLTKAFEGK